MLATETNRTPTYACDGSTVAFPVPFKFNQSTDLEVILTDSTGTMSTLVLGTDYTVTGAGLPSGGTVTATTVYDSGNTIDIFRVVPLVQDTAFSGQSSFRAETHEQAFDLIMMRIQQLQEQIDRAAVLPKNMAGDGPMETIGEGEVVGVVSGKFVGLAAAAADLAANLLSGLATKGAALLTYLAPFTGAVARSLRERLGDAPGSRDWGAVLDGATDDGAAIRAQIAALVADRKTYTSTVATHSTADIRLPRGVVYLTAPLTTDTSDSIDYVRFIGEGTIIKCAPGITAFGGVGPHTHFEGIHIHGGATAISLKTNNINGAIVSVERCQFIGQTDSVFAMDATSQSTLFTVRRSRVFTPASDSSTTRILYALSGDYKVFEDCFFQTCGVNAAFYNGDGNGFLALINCVLVPGHTTTPAPAWVDNYGTVRAFHTRFGGENGGVQNIVRNYASADVSYPVTPRSVILDTCECYVNSSTGKYLVAFYAIPNRVSIHNCTGLVGANSRAWFYVDAAVSASGLAAIGGAHFSFEVDGNQFPITRLVDYTSGAATGIGSLPWASCRREAVALPPVAANVIINDTWGTTSYTRTQSGTVAATGTTDTWGNSAMVVAATADGQYNYSNKTTFLNGLSAGLYTLAVGVDVITAHNLNVQVECGTFSARFQLARGAHLLEMPVWYDGGASKTLSVQVEGLPNTASYRLGRAALYQGLVSQNERRITIEGASAPASGQWWKGDRCVNSSPAVGSAKAWVCTVAGAPGTWVSEGNL